MAITLIYSFSKPPPHYCEMNQFIYRITTNSHMHSLRQDVVYTYAVYWWICYYLYDASSCFALSWQLESVQERFRHTVGEMMLELDLLQQHNTMLMEQLQTLEENRPAVQQSVHAYSPLFCCRLVDIVLILIVAHCAWIFYRVCKC